MKTLFFLLSFTLTLDTWSQSLDSTFSQPGGFTDQQTKEAQNFQHQGVKDDYLKKACAKANGACDQDSPDKQNVLLPGAIENQIGLLYSAMGMMMGTKVKLKDRPADPSTNTETAGSGSESAAGSGSTSGSESGEKREGTDYCLYGAMALEGVATVMQMGQQQNISQETQNLNDPQLQALVSLKETHRARKKTATFQSAIFGATSACYVARAALGGIAMDAKYIIKMSAAAGITALYLKKADKHKTAMDKIQTVIDGMPKAGDCNPWTGTSCFCSHSKSPELYPSQYQEVCVLNNGIANGPKSNLGCGVMVNGQVQFDEKCNCKSNNTCVTASLRFGNPTIGLGTNFLKSANADYSLLDPSQFDEGKLRAFSNNALAMNQKLKPKGNVPNVNLTDEQKKAADALKDVVPPAVANFAASLPPSSVGADSQFGSASGQGLAALTPEVKKKLGTEIVKGKYRSSGGSSSSGSADEGFSFQMPKFGGQEAARADVNLDQAFLAEKAINNADVSNQPDTPIFDIISNRYRSSGWKKLDRE